MRDDFLLHCQSFESLAPLFSELTPLGPPTGASLRRAVVQPALKCGYRFEDEAIVEEMLSEVEGQRGALPLLAFAAAQLWERRDRETGLLTRKSYGQIGGVAGALAQHAEAILDYLGESNAPIVRELFRNLVTAQGTRAARDRTELLSVFAEKGEAKGGQVPFFGVDETQESSAKKKVPVPLLPGNEDSVPLSSAEEVLSSLIDARLLTSYEVPADDDGGGPHQRIEIVHESLLSNWPRLARWQIQDAEGAQLRDELRNQAQLWEQHSRSEDYLWTGTAFREFELWRERYPGALTTTEEDFVRAMRSHADRRRRRRRLALTAVIVVLLAVLSVVTWSRFEAKVEARRAEAANLRSLAQLHLRRSPSEAIAYAIASLENADDPEMRYLALEALWRRPTEFRLPRSSPTSMEFSPDGRWLATADHNGGGTLWPSDGGPPTALENSDVAMEIRISPRGDLVAATMDTERQELGLWSFPGARFLRSFALGDQGATFNFQFSRDGERLLTSTEMPDGVGLVRSWPVEGGEPKLIARLEIPVENAGTFFGVDPTESRLSWPDGRRVRIAQMEGTSVDMSSVASVEHDRAVSALVFDEKGRHLALADSTGTVRIWSVEIDPPRLIRSLRGQGGYAATAYRFDSFGSKLAGAYGLLWDLAAPPDARVLDFGGGAYGLAFDPTGKWLATGAFGTPRLWPLARTYPQVLPGHEEWVWGVSFTPDGKYLVSMSQDGSVRLWPLDSSSDERSRIVYRAEGAFAVPSNFATAPDGSFAVTGNPLGQVLVLPFNGGPVRELAGFADVINRVAVGPKSRLVAAGSGTYIREEGIVRIWDLETDETQILDVGDGERISYLDFTDQGDLLVHSGQKLRRWDLAEDPPRIVAQIELSVPEATGVKVADLSPDGRQVLLVATFGNESRLWLRDLDTGASRELSSRGTDVNTATFDPTGDIIVSGDAQGIRVGLTQGGEPHLLLSSERDMTFVAVSPDGRWIASEANSENYSIRLWPMPDLSTATAPHATARRSCSPSSSPSPTSAPSPTTQSSTGWKIEIGPFPGLGGGADVVTSRNGPRESPPRNGNHFRKFRLFLSGSCEGHESEQRKTTTSPPREVRRDDTTGKALAHKHNRLQPLSCSAQPRSDAGPGGDGQSLRKSH